MAASVLGDRIGEIASVRRVLVLVFDQLLFGRKRDASAEGLPIQVQIGLCMSKIGELRPIKPIGRENLDQEGAKGARWERGVGVHGAATWTMGWEKRQLEFGKERARERQAFWGQALACRA